MVINIKGYSVLIDDEDFESVTCTKWYAVARETLTGNLVYFINTKRGVANKTKLHRFLAGCIKNDGHTVDHINGDTLDNRKCNLRVCTIAENSRNQKILFANTSGYKGVSWHKGKKPWQAQIKINKKIIHLGTYTNKEDAYEAYKTASAKYHGEFGRVK